MKSEISMLFEKLDFKLVHVENALYKIIEETKIWEEYIEK